ncbi:MAG: bifunctional glutamate N-acetyltransferase/amino-acid acetyltransferase ArgJ [Lactobacillus sp.]|jgi:glutamate N-acetyltransferase/amino-acid N-acetyltransferase|nr:bifunctional glutamate N-acetyltransferase/amino-acid acetyltransferase ArgJ [Lactobacillus sp.]MCI2031938.1 bifunctional glutamate N-acetyltransferase/amino-acid acetyltransferase ArgJ [Lactobacillus sp.]
MTINDTFMWPAGFYTDGVQAGLRDRNDMGWLVSKVPAAAAGTYTTSQFVAAPTKLCKQLIGAHHRLQAIVMNSVIANSCTGQLGWDNALSEQAQVAEKLEIEPELVGVASTGLIGAQLPMAKIHAGIEALQLKQDAGVTTAVMTTDTHAKIASTQLMIDGKQVTISGFAKGSGMIHPKMATMLGFVFTDANISGLQLQGLLSASVDETFNQITVDGDTSTNDMVTVMANGLADNHLLTASHPDYAAFSAALSGVLAKLAQGIAADGEGATKLVEVNLHHASTHADAQHAAKAIVGSNLVKAAIFGEDPNWGRIISALGQTTVKIDVDHVAITLNGFALVKDSLELPFDEAAVKQAMAAHKITIDVDLNSGDASGQAWGCDLTYNYVKINASYRS